VTIGIPAKG